jgi:hypothetical protein
VIETPLRFEDLWPEDERPLRRTSITEMEIADALLSSLNGSLCPVDPCDNTAQFVERHRLRIDGVAFDLGPTGAYKHLREVFEDEHPTQAFMAGAQTGKSARLMAGIVRHACGPAWGRLMGYYFPDKHLPSAFSKERFKPFMRTNADLGRLIGRPSVRSGGAKGVENVLATAIGETTLFFLTIGGKTSTEGLPLKAVYFDEVRRMKQGDIERAMERYSAQIDPIDWKVSTAGLPETNIHKYFLQGDQRYFHSSCKCAEGTVLSLNWPNCIADLRGATPALRAKVAHAYHRAGLPYLGLSEADRHRYPDAAYICARCGEIVVDPREGWWEAHAPNNWAHSYQMPQLLSVTYPAGRVLEKFENATDTMEFFTSALGLPYVDRNKMPLTKDQVLACVDSSAPWAKHLTVAQRERRMKNTAMGVDVQAGYLVAVVKALTPNGKFATVHLEIVVHETNPWLRLGEMMDEFDVRCCVIDEAPEYTASANFARSFPGRVFLANYGLGPASPRFVSWGDQQLANDKTQKGKDTAIRHRVSIDRTRALEWCVKRWANRLNVLPTPERLVQVLPRQGGKPVLSAHLRMGQPAPTAIALDLYVPHLCSLVFLDEYDGDIEAKRQGKSKIVAEFVGEDPHFVHADLYCSTALDRIGRPGGVRGLGGEP